MKVEFVRLLQIQRDLYRLPRGWERFHAYLKTMVDPRTGDLALPLVPMNPMGRDHVPAVLDEYIRLDADRTAEHAVLDVGGGYEDIGSSFKVALVVADDLKGGWTNRYASEFSYRFEARPLHKRGWLVGILWTSEPPSAEVAAKEALMAVHRGAYLEKHGPARTLREMLDQEGFVAAAARCRAPILEPEDLAYTREVIAPLLAASDRPTVIAGLFGDAAAQDLGYPSQGLSARDSLWRFTMRRLRCNKPSSGEVAIPQEAPCSSDTPRTLDALSSLPVTRRPDSAAFQSKPSTCCWR